MGRGGNQVMQFSKTLLQLDSLQQKLQTNLSTNEKVCQVWSNPDSAQVWHEREKRQVVKLFGLLQPCHHLPEVLFYLDEFCRDVKAKRSCSNRMTSSWNRFVLSFGLRLLQQ